MYSLLLSQPILFHWIVDFIWKQLSIPETNENNKFHAGTNCSNFTFPPAQHYPVFQSLKIWTKDWQFCNFERFVGTVIHFRSVMKRFRFIKALRWGHHSCSLCRAHCYCAWRAKTHCILSLATPFYVTLERNSDITIRQLLLSVACWSSVRSHISLPSMIHVSMHVFSSASLS